MLMSVACAIANTPIDMGGLHCNLRPWWYLCPGWCWGPCLSPKSRYTGISADFHASCYHQSHVDACILGWYLKPCWFPWDMLLLNTISGLIKFLWPGSVLVSVACVTTKDHSDIYHLCYKLKFYWYPWTILPPGTILMQIATLPPRLRMMSIIWAVFKVLSGSVRSL